MKHLPVHGKLSEKMNWHLSRALKMSRHCCGQDSVGPEYWKCEEKKEKSRKSFRLINLNMEK